VHAVELGERIVAELARRSDPVEDTDRVSGSVGISVSVAGTGTAESMLGEADTAMYQAKSLGGGRAEVFDAALGLQVLERAVALGMVRTALDDDRVVVHYQPVVELADQRITGFEALARIVAADGSLLAPSAFIPVAEDSGLVVPLGTHVLDRACRDAAGWPTAGPLSVAVNLSARQFEPGTLTTLVRDLLELTALDPGRLHLELTETAVIDLLPDLVSQLGRLRALGVEIGLDDFGTGYASLTHLRRLPLTFVKIDQSFVRGLGDDREDERIVAAVVDLARNLGLRSIAEGVETRGQLERLRDLGCDQAQGFLFARAMPAEAVGQAVTRS
jgi:predicted signal transduction protein with EAL and GGDEF domain